MPNNKHAVKLAVVQAAPVFLDRAATVEKACSYIRQAGKEGAALVAFPESFIPAYPDWVWAVPPGEEGTLNELYAGLFENAVEIPRPDTQALCQAARAAGVYVVVGVTERSPQTSNGSLYNTLLYIDPQGSVMGRHRKLVPTGGERLVWAPGDGSTLQVYDTPLGKIGGLICWENYMPLARYSLYAWGVQIYIAATWDRGEAWLATVRHIAREGRVYVLSSGMALRKADIPDRFAFKKKFYANAPEWINVGESAIVNPQGDFVAGPLREKEGLLFATLDPAAFHGSKWMLDVTGHYNRPDVFQLTVDRTSRLLIKEAGEPRVSIPAVQPPEMIDGLITP